MWGGSEAPGPELEPGLELLHPQSLEAPKGKGTCLRSHRAGRGPRPGNKTVGDKKDFKAPLANVLVLQVEKLRRSGRKRPVSQLCGRAAWQLALQSAMEKRIALTEWQFFSFRLGMELTEVQRGWACPGHFTAACLLQLYCFLPHLWAPKLLLFMR